MASRRRGLSSLLFVYGTLRRGEANHGLMTGARFVALARTLPRYELADLGSYPALVEPGSTVVEGELYRVEPTLLARLDRLERHPDWYRRGTVWLQGRTEADDPVQAYLLPSSRAAGAARITTGRWQGTKALGKGKSSRNFSK